MAALNKRILCFIDECGTAGQNDFSLGCVMVWARESGKADKALSDLLEPNVNELHAVNLSKEYLESLLGRYAQTDRPEMILMNRMGSVVDGDAPTIYAKNVIETVKAATKQFQTHHNIRGRGIGNIQLIMDQNHHNSHPECQRLLNEALRNDGRFKAVNDICLIDSAASRLLQLSDLMAYSRTWIRNGEVNAKGLRNNFGIIVI